MLRSIRDRIFSHPIAAVLAGALILSLGLNAGLGYRLYGGQIREYLSDHAEVMFPVAELTVTPQDHVRGPSGAKVTVIEYSDYQCPYCRAAHKVMKELSSEIEFRWVMRHYPIPEIHPLAIRAAVAAECANLQGKFWEYSDGLFAPDPPFTDSRLKDTARTTGLNLERFNACLAHEQFTSVIDPNRSEWLRTRIDGTPTFYINNRRLIGSLPREEMKKLIQSLQ
jgi:protein-disulfide isomerase